MSDHMEQQMDRIMDNNENVDSRCVPGCGYFGPWKMQEKEIEKLVEENNKLRELIKHCYIHAGYRNCGYDQMTTEQKELYDSIRKADNI